jgi:ABC-type spermidine/putrescine transport system permease subunit II
MAAQAPTLDVTAAAPAAAAAPSGATRERRGLAPYLLATPLILVFLAFFAVPMLLVVTVSFFDYESYQILIPAFTLQNYIDVFTESVTWQTYWITFKFCVIVWAITLILGVAAQPTPRDSNHLIENGFSGFQLNPPSEIKLENLEEKQRRYSIQ